MERLRLLRVKRPVIKKQPDEKEPQETEPHDEKEPQETEPHDEKEPQETEPHVYSQRIQRVIERLGTLTRSDIILLKNPTVIQWLYGDTSFLPPALSKNKTALTATWKVQEDKWGQEMMRIRRPDLKLEKQWTNRFGEYLCEEILLLHGQQPYKPMKKNNYQPDVEVAVAIWEAKAQTYYTEGTAGEKILGCPFKYAEIPDLYSKPLYILCIGGAEKLSREKYGNLPGPKQTPQKQRILQTFRELRIEYVGYTDLLEQWIEYLP